MRRPWAAVMPFLVLVTAGCLGGSGEESGPTHAYLDGCQEGVCAVDPADYPEWVLPDGAQALLAFSSPYGAVRDVVRVPSGWAWIADHDGPVLERYAASNGTLRRTPVELGAPATDLAWDGRGLHAVIGTTPNPTILHWIGDRVTSASMPLAGTPSIKGADTSSGLLLRTVRPTEDAFAFHVRPDGSWAPVRGANGTFDADLAGNLIVRQDGLGSADAVGGAIVLQDIVTGSEHVVANSTRPLLGVWANGGRIAYAIDAADGPELWEIDTRTHAARLLGPGTAPRFVDGGYYFEQLVGAANRDIWFYSEALASAAPVFFPNGDAWDVDGTQAWWLATPSTDPRFEEAPNPTPFVTVLYQRG